jgi:hypothetical protein
MELPGGRDISMGNLNITQFRRPSPYRKPRYQEVAAEFERLGETAFIQTYFTPNLKARIQNAAHKRPVYGIPQPGHDQYAYDHFGIVTDAYSETFRIDWIDEGWLFSICKPDGSPKWDDRFQYRGDDKEKPFASSTAAFNYVRGVA